MINLYYNYFKHPERQTEIDFCLKKNQENPLLNVVLVEGRPTYQQLFDLINEETNEEDINIIANSDIFFDDTIKYLESIKSQFVCLTRKEWIDNSPKDFFMINKCKIEWSQDVWAWRGKCKLTGVDNVLAEDLKTRNTVKIPFTLGIAGCDNHLAYLASRHYQLINPYYSVNANHVHKEIKRETKFRIKGHTGSNPWLKLKSVKPTK